MARITKRREAERRAYTWEAEVISEATEMQRAACARAADTILHTLASVTQHQAGQELTILQDPLPVPYPDSRLDGKLVVLVQFGVSELVTPAADSEPVKERYEVRPWRADGDYTRNNALASMIPASRHHLDVPEDFVLPRTPVIEEGLYGVQVDRFRGLVAALAMQGGVDLSEVAIGDRPPELV